MRWARAGGAPVPSLLVNISSHAYIGFSFSRDRGLRDRSHSAWWAHLDSGRLSGRDLLALPSTCAASSISTTGTTMETPLSWTTSTSPSFLTGRPFSEDKNNTWLPTSTERKEESVESSSFGCATMPRILSELFPELNWSGITLT